MPYFKYDGSTAAETVQPTTNNFGTSAVETLTGGSGADGLYGSDRDTLIGGAGDDTYYFQGNNISVVEAASAGVDKIVAWQNVNLAKTPNVENLEVGGNGAPGVYGAGNQLDNLIVANGSLQQLYGGAGQDVLVGSASGADTFIVIKGEGNDALYNFDPAKDVLRLSAGYTSFGQVQSHMTQVGGDLKIDLGGADALILRNVASSQLTAANFQLQLDPAKLAPLTFHDEFNDAQLSIWDGESNPSGVWRPDYGYAGSQGTTSYTLASNGEQQIYVSPYFRDAPGNYALTPFSESGGALTITAQPAPANAADLWGYHYTSGMITTKETFAQTYGYFEMRAELPQNAGGWPAFWLLPADGSWPPELDVMETLTKDPSADYTTSHSNVGNTHSMSQGVSFIPQTSDGFHTYGVLWTASTLTWYVDGVQVFATPTPADMNKPMYMLANLALGGWGGSVDDAQLPAQMKIDYIRAYGLADGSSSVAYDKAASGGGTAAPNVSGSNGGGTGASADGGSSGVSSPSSPTGPQLLVASGSNSVLTGGPGADTIKASEGYDTLTGGGGADVFVFGKEPWAPIHITDFQVGVDKIDLSALFQKSGYTGSDPVADGYVYLLSDGADGTIVRFDRDGTGSNPVWPNTIIDLEHVSPNGLTWAQLQGAASSGGASSGSAGSGSSSVGGPAVGGGGAATVTPTGGRMIYAPDSGGALDGGSGGDTIYGSASASTTIRGFEGDDQITGGLGFNQINGNLGSDTISGRSQVGDDLMGGQGADVISTTQSTAHNRVNGNKGDDTITGSNFGDTLHGGQGADLIVGGSGNDWISGDLGADTVSGGAGADRFHQFAGGGVSTVNDFHYSEGDRVQLDPGDTWRVSQQGSDVVVDIDGGGGLILRDVRLDSLGSDWIFAG